MKNDELPDIDTEYFELAMQIHKPDDLPVFIHQKDEFKKLIFTVIKELGLLGKIKFLKVDSHLDVGRAEIHREKGYPFPSKMLTLCMYLDRYMDENLIRHEFMHEADRHNPTMGYDKELENKWMKYGRYERNVFEMIINISVDSRLNGKGLSKDQRRKNFHDFIGEDCDHLFEDIWVNPPLTWPDFEETTLRLLSETHPDSPILNSQIIIF